MCQVISGSGLGFGTANVWQALSTDRSYGYGISGSNVSISGTLRISIRYNGGATIAQADYALSAFAYTL